MVAVVESYEVVTLSGQDPAAEGVTVDSNATAVYMLWSYFIASAGQGLSSVTLNSVSPDESGELANDSTSNGTGWAAWYSPTTGSVNLDVAWDATPTYGPLVTLVYVSGGNLTAITGSGTDQQGGATTSTVDVTSTATDLVLKMYANGQDITGTTGGWTTIVESTVGGTLWALVEQINASGTPVTCASNGDEFYSSVVGISIPEAAGGTSIEVPLGPVW